MSVASMKFLYYFNIWLYAIEFSHSVYLMIAIDKDFNIFLIFF